MLMIILFIFVLLLGDFNGGILNLVFGNGLKNGYV